MAETMILTEDQAIELFTFFIACARTQLDDPSHYASMRFLTAAEMLRDYIGEHVSPEAQELLSTTVDKTERAHIIMNDTDAYAGALDELNAIVAQYLVAQSGLGRRMS